MRRMRAGLIAAIALVSVCGLACSQGPKSKELTALDDAYKSGVLTSDEYAVKKTALDSEAVSLAALDKAFAAGVLTQEEYQSRRAKLDAAVASLAALEKARKDGVLTSDEYAAKKSALLASHDPLPEVPVPTQGADTPQVAATAPVEYRNVQSVNAQPARPAPQQAPNPATNPPTNKPPTNKTSPTPASDAHTYKMKMVKVVDEHGFERPMVSATMLIPVDWQSQGSTTWNIKDSCNTIQTSLKASGPDGRAYEVFPGYAWSWADDPTFLRQAFAQKAQFGTHACDVQAPIGAADYVKQNIGRIRPNARIVAIEPAPKLMDMLQQQARQTEQSAAQYRLQQKVRPDVVKARLKYTLNGQPVEEWIVAATVITGTLGPSYDVRTMRQTQAYSYSCYGTMVAMRAPQGQLDASEKFFDLLNSTFHLSPAWQSRVAGNAQAIQRIEQKGIADRSAIVTKNAEDIRKIQQEGYENQQKSQDESYKGFSQVIRGVESYRDPTSGEKVELDSNYGHAWVNNSGVYLLSDSAGFDPNTVSTETWKPLEHVKP